MPLCEAEVLDVGERAAARVGLIFWAWATKRWNLLHPVRWRPPCWLMVIGTKLPGAGSAQTVSE